MLVIDMQNGFIPKKYEDEFKAVLEYIKVYIRSGDYDEVIATRFINKRNSNFDKRLEFNKMYDGEEIELIESLKPLVTRVVDKHTYGIPSKLVTYLKGKEVILDGTDLDGAVLAVAYQLFDAGIEFKIYKNCCSTSAIKNRAVYSHAEQVIFRNIKFDKRFN